MIPLITQTPRLTILAASRALLTAELHKPHYFPVLLGAVLPADWPSGEYDRATAEHALDKLTEGGRHAAGWYGWHALRKAEGDTPRTLVGSASFAGPPDAAGTAEINFAIANEWRRQGLGTELLAGLVAHAADTALVRRLVAYVGADNPGAEEVLRRNGFAPTGPAEDGRLRFERAVEPAAK